VKVSGWWAQKVEGSLLEVGVRIFSLFLDTWVWRCRVCSPCPQSHLVLIGNISILVFKNWKIIEIKSLCKLC
jgi:hypothetical protein